MELLRNFKKLSKGDVGLAGGKGASLGEMTQVGIPVPPGFVILSASFEKFIEETKLVAEIDAILDSVNHEEIHTGENASEKIQALILGANMPKDIAQEITSSFKKLGAKYVAVRSSATAEDSSSAAWAGQLDSFLNTTEAMLLQNVKRCWASLFTPRAIFYRFEKNLHKQKISVAVVVQKMVESEISGIAFSVHPVTEDRNQLIIEASYGLGEAIVSGQVTPDSYVVEKEPRQIIERMVQAKLRGLYRLPRGENEWKEIPEPRASKQALSDKQILELSALIIRIENHYGFPCDIEWAFEKSKFYIVQSRPITTLMQQNVDANSGVISIIEEEKLEIRKSDYVLTFWARGIKGLVTDISKDMYIALDPLYVVDDGMYRQYFIKERFDWAGKEGIKFYGNRKNFLAYQKNLRQIVQELSVFYKKEIKNRKTITKERARGFLGLCVDLCENYTKLDFEYTDKAFLLRNKNKDINFTLELMGKFKDDVRASLNTALFENDSYIQNFLSVLAKQFDVPISSLENYIQSEILGLFDGRKVEKNILLKRAESFAILTKNHQSEYYEGEDAKHIAQQLEEKVEHTREITGQTANRGKIVGNVRVIRVDYGDLNGVTREIKKMKQGEVLVAETTAPELMLACKKASAIITDIGGMMSHAAIVSRELGIPCIVGTKIATQVLKDGDMVEVDADKGILRIINSDDTGSDLMDLIAKTNWMTLKSSLTPLLVGYGAKQWTEIAAQRFPKYRVMDYCVFYAEKDGSLGTFAIDEGQYIQCAKALFNNLTDLQKIYDIFSKDEKKFYAALKKLHKAKNFIKEYPSFIAAYDMVYSSGIPIDGFLAYSQSFVDDIKKKYPKRIHEIDVLIQPYSLSFLQKETLSLLKIATRRGGNLAAHQQKFHWIQNNYAKADELPFSYFKKELKQLQGKSSKDLEKEIIELEQYFKKHVAEVKGIEKRKVFSKLDFERLLWIGKIGWWVDRRKACNLIANHEILEYVRKIGPTLKIPYMDLLFLMPSELEKVIQNPASVSNYDLKDRRKMSAVAYTKDGKWAVWTGRDAEKLKEIIDPSVIKKSEEIRGAIAYKGKVSGVVRVIFDPRDQHKFNNGDILVTGMTRPDFVPLMKRSAAVITDEGGVTCHAAIVSRELKVPCIIGTKIATKILKDGDLVEVDANSGVIRILK